MIELKNETGRTSCRLRWLLKAEGNRFDEIEVTLKSKDEFEVTRTVFHSRDTFLNLTNDILAPGEDQLPNRLASK